MGIDNAKKGWCVALFFCIILYLFVVSGKKERKSACKHHPLAASKFKVSTEFGGKKSRTDKAEKLFVFPLFLYVN